MEAVENAQEAVGADTPKAEVNIPQEERSDPEAERNAAALEASRQAVRRGDAPWSGLGPRPPANVRALRAETLRFMDELEVYGGSKTKYQGFIECSRERNGGGEKVGGCRRLGRG